MPAGPDEIKVAQLLRQRAEAEPPSSGREQRIAALNQYLSACNREARDRLRPRAAPTAKF